MLKKLLNWLFIIAFSLIITAPIIFRCLNIRYNLAVTRLLEQESSYIQSRKLLDQRSHQTIFNELTETAITETNTTWFVEMGVGNYSRSFPIYTTSIKVVSRHSKWFMQNHKERKITIILPQQNFCLQKKMIVNFISK